VKRDLAQERETKDIAEAHRTAASLLKKGLAGR
jgi:hypothetical protein